MVLFVLMSEYQANKIDDNQSLSKLDSIMLF